MNATLRDPNPIAPAVFLEDLGDKRKSMSAARFNKTLKKVFYLVMSSYGDKELLRNTRDERGFLHKLMLYFEEDF